MRSLFGKYFGIFKTKQAPAQPDESDRLARVYAPEAVLKLHFGCGPRILKGWINIDLKYAPYEPYLKYYKERHYPEEIRGDRSELYLFDITKAPLPLPDDSVEVVFHEDFLEHLNQRDQVLFLAECFRVLKPGGVHRVNTPDLSESMRSRSVRGGGWRGVYTDEWNAHKHQSVLTKGMLEEMALMVGYSKVLFNARDCSVSGEIPLEYRPDPDDRSEAGNIFADLIK